MAHRESQGKVQPFGALDLHLKDKAVHNVLVPVVQIAELVRLQVLEGENTSENCQISDLEARNKCFLQLEPTFQY